MVLSDSDPRKWTLKEHTRVKHELLNKYLTPWIYKLGSANRELLYIDGFAGRGEYNEAGKSNDIGSPIIAMRKAQEHRAKIPKFWCLFVEKDKENFDNLCMVIEREKASCPHPKINCVNGDFEAEVTKLLDEKQGRLPPTFCFIDPFGFNAPFSVVKRIMAIPRAEIFFTFMSRDINRFTSSEIHTDALNKLFGTSAWEEIKENPEIGHIREKYLLNLYKSQLDKEAKVKYIIPFMVKMPEKQQTLYYLIHATNSFHGFKIMKDIMNNRSSSEIFGYLGPEEGQTSLSKFSLEGLQKYLQSAYSGQTITFDNLIIQSYPVEEVFQYVEKEYREILKKMEKSGVVTVRRITSKSTGLGLSGKDLITFS